MTIKTITIIFSSLILLMVINLIRKEHLTFKYAFGWIIISILAMFFSVFEKHLFNIAYFFGFELPSNFIFFTLLCAFVIMSLYLTIFLCKQNSRNDIMAQKIALLEFEIDQIKKEKDKKST